FDLVVRQWPFEPFDATLCRLTRGELAHQIAIPHTHVDDALMRAASRAEQVVHHGQLQQFADVGEFLLMLWRSVIGTDCRCYGAVLVICIGQCYGYIVPLDQTVAARRRWLE